MCTLTTSPFATYIAGGDESDHEHGVFCRPVQEYFDVLKDVLYLKRAYDLLKDLKKVP